MMMTPSTIQEEEEKRASQSYTHTHTHTSSSSSGGLFSVLKYLVRDRIVSSSLYIHTDTCTVPALIKMTLIT